MLTKESKIRVLENFYALDYVFFGRADRGCILHLYCVQVCPRDSGPGVHVDFEPHQVSHRYALILRRGGQP